MSNLLLGRQPLEINWVRPEELTNGNNSVYDNKSGYAFVVTPGTLTFDLENLIDVATIRFLLYDRDERAYQYKLSTSIDLVNFIEDFTTSDQGTKGWQVFNFSTTNFTRYIRLDCLHNTANAQFHIIQFECYAKGAKIPALPKPAVLELDIAPLKSRKIDTTGAYILPSVRLNAVADTLNSMSELAKKTAGFDPEYFIKLRDEILDQINGITEIEKNIGSIQKLVLEPVKQNLISSTVITIVSGAIGLVSLLLFLLDWLGVIQV